jgi:protein SCO1/2
MLNNKRMAWPLSSVALGMAACFVMAAPLEVGIEEHLGQILPLETFTLNDEDGRPIVLKELFDRPVILTFVYFRCPGICTPLLQELSKNVNNCDLTPGQDYRMVTVGFDPTETAELAKAKQANMIATVDKKEMSTKDWRFLTGDAETVKRLTDAVGFYYVKDKNEVDYVHAASVIFLSAEGKIVRYLNTMTFNPADVKMAVLDASEGRARSFMQKIQALCYTYDPASRGYVLQLNRVILGVTVVFVMVFVAFLLLRKTRRTEGAPREGGETQ